MSQKKTIKDVAERAGCSIATVSRVLNGSGPASQEKRDQVMRAAEELGFRFNELGRSLQSRRSRTIGIIVPALTNPVFAEAIEGIQAAADEAGYQVLLNCANYEQDRELDCLSTLLAKQVDGLILTVSDPEDCPTLRLIEKSHTPYCLIFNQTGSGRHAEVGVDNVAAARRVGEALMDAGHRTVAFVAVRFSTSDRSRQRYAGLCAALAAAGAPEPRLLEVDYEPRNLENALAALFAGEPQTTALFASNDMLALACMRALRAIGRSVPGDVSVIGFDGISIGDLVHPRLATITTPGREMGAHAARIIVDALKENRKPPPETVALPFAFRSGESLAPPGNGSAGGRAATPPPAAFSTLPDSNQTK
jgi:DNA-binding LacI/PurR family transcriptional regulator